MLKIVALFIFLCLATIPQYAQSKLSSSDLSKIDELIDKKHDLELNNELKSTYKIQVFSGALEKAKENLNKLEEMKLGMVSKIVYQTPNYKVWIGSFRTRIQADRANELLKSEYPNALIIKPGK